MKKLLLSFVLFLVTCFAVWGQAPNLMNYQGVARNTAGVPHANTNMSLRLTIRDGSATGVTDYQETHNVITNAFGLYNVAVGSGTPTSGTFSSINWGSGTKWMQVEIDPAGGSSYTNLGASQLLSVPYALYAANGGSSTSYISGTGINISGTTINALTTNALWNADELQGIGISTTVPTSGQVLTFNGTIWQPTTLSSGGGGTVTSVTAGAGLSGGTITTSGTISMPNVGAAGTYGSASQVPVITTDAQGRISNVTLAAITGGGSGTVTSVNTTAPITGGPITSSGTIGLATSGVTPTTYGTATQVPQITVDAHGLITSAANLTITPTTSVTMGGDVTGPSSGCTVAKIQGVPVSATVPISGQVMELVGGTWTPTTPGSSSGWSLTGNASTTPGTNFIGTTDAQNLVFKVNNQPAGLVDQGSNTLFGYQAGLVNTGGQNSFLGASSGYSNTSGGQNTAVGQASLYYNTTGSYNTAVGRAALSTNSTASYNTALGYWSLHVNTTGAGNTAVGAQSLENNTIGNYNTAVGASLLGNSTGNNNTGVGYAALLSSTNSDNTAIGYYSQYAAAGSQNTSVGSGTLTNGGSYNTVVGFQGLNNNTGNYNTAIGWWSLYQNTSGISNTALGEEALYNNTTGNSSTAVGTSALYHNTTNNGGTAVGANALFYSTGGFNTAVGNVALYTNTTGTNNTAIGSGADVSSGGLTNATAIGYATTVNASNTVRIGNSLVTVIEGQVAYSYPSDGRFKTNVKDNVKGLDFINKLRPVTYNFEAKKFDEFLMKNKPDSVRNKIINSNDYTKAESVKHSGFIAQEVEQAAKETDYNFSGLHVPANENENYSLAYSEFTVPLVKAVQELSAQNDALQKTIKNQGQKIDELEKKMDELMAQKR